MHVSIVQPLTSRRCLEARMGASSRAPPPARCRARRNSIGVVNALPAAPACPQQLSVHHHATAVQDLWRTELALLAVCQAVQI